MVDAGEGGSLVSGEMHNQVSAKGDWGRSRWHWVGAVKEMQSLWDVCGQHDIQGDVFAVLVDCHTGKCSSCNCQMFAELGILQWRLSCGGASGE